MVSQTEVIDAVNAAATSFGMDGTELEQLLGYVASMPADEYRDFTSPVAGVQDPKAILELVRSRFKAQGVAYGSQHSVSITAVPAAGAPAPTAQPYVDMAMLKDLLAEQARSLKDALVEEARLQKDALAEQARLQNDALARWLAEHARLQKDALAEQARLQNDALAEQSRLRSDALARSLAEQARSQKDALAEQARLQNDALARSLAEQARSLNDALAEQARLHNDALARSLAEQARSLKDTLAEQKRSLTANVQEGLVDNAPRRHHPNWAAPRRQWAMSKAAVPKEKKVL
ncbi:hypothetical protein CHLRE_03g208497v5 [Chlamydomonas reinhardtii]|uniref:Uncharacterized protein n=1 Tax=Chlamydomonas reinhardtii TaxID=3055 RepID=A0A2K3DZW3_CHLRE|nr:uncharacterized protein CHLRE_03g208497v5 [Chlamydomonas reinhardtii]PNW86047.1 hypothetical protein CHLRE_03g208497v5 [Chlamydomonas reinhardtii]